MSISQSTDPSVDRASEKRFISEALYRVEQLERQRPESLGANFGSWHQQIPLQYFGSGAPVWDTTGYAWVTDNSFSTGGYVGADANGDFFTCLVLLGPKGSIWQIGWAANDGPDFGRFTFALASLEYESDARPSGDPTGKISPVDGSYGSFTYVDALLVGQTFTDDGYAAISNGETYSASSIPFIVGGDEGDPLTDFTPGNTDPMLGFTIMDGGPGWYRFKVYTDGKNGASSGYKVQISNILFTRRADDNHP